MFENWSHIIKKHLLFARHQPEYTRKLSTLVCNKLWLLRKNILLNFWKWKKSHLLKPFFFSNVCSRNWIVVHCSFCTLHETLKHLIWYFNLWMPLLMIWLYWQIGLFYLDNLARIQFIIPWNTWYPCFSKSLNKSGNETLISSIWWLEN